jgi:tetratricopeptide (TPR) repeat protein
LTVIKDRGNHYETLGIEKTAPDEEIKRAYYRMVRQYQPDRFPEEFKKIRAAYEVLSDREQRAKYDEVGELPASVVPLLREAEREFRTGKDSKAFEIYRKILKSHPDLDVIRERYAESLELRDKDRKAAEVWEELCARHPDHVSYAKSLCKCYVYLGWNKKACAVMQRVLALDETSIDSWVLFVVCSINNAKDSGQENTIENVMEKALRAVKPIKTDEWKKVPLFVHAFMVTGPKKYDTSVGYLREIARLIRENGREGQNEGEHALEKMLEIPAEVLGKFYPELKIIAGLLSETVTEPFSDDMDDIRLQYEIEHLPRKGFAEIFRDLFQELTTEFSHKGENIEIVAIEYALLRGRIVYNPQIKRLKTEFPELYALHKTFFDKALQSGDPDTMRRERSKQLEKYDRQFGNFDGEAPLDFDSAPLRRDQPKVGRNDPCPCGSGKKYKKCCGA